jgi:hypothetical protein
MDKPPITFLGASPANVWTTGKMKPTSIVIHTMSGSYEGTASWFRQAVAEASSNYGIAEDGRAACYVDPMGSLSPYANGGIFSPDQEFLDAYARNGNRNPNLWTISIEHEDKLVPQHQITNYPSQFEGSTLVSAWLCGYFGIDPQAPGSFLGHYQIDGVNRRSCPGWSAATWDAYIAEVTRKCSAGAVIAPPVLSLQQEVDRLKRLVAGNGWTTDFSGPNDAPLNFHVGDEALKTLDDGGSSAFAAIFEIAHKLAKAGLA